MLEGEGIVARRGEWRWDLDRDPGNAGVYSSRRIIVLRDRQGPRPAITLDLEHETLETVYAMRGVPKAARHLLGRTLAGVAGGAFDEI